jgi:hypothetical protein
MAMLRGMYNFEQTRKVKIYDPNEPDKNKKLIFEFDSIKDAARALGMTENIVRRAANDKNRRFCKLLDKEISIR